MPNSRQPSVTDDSIAREHLQTRGRR